MKGEMNPRERWGLLLIDEFPDRPPVFPLVTSHAAKIHGCNLIEYCTDGKIMAEAQLKAYKRYGMEGLSIFTDVGIIAEAMGSKYELREFEVPIIIDPIVKDSEQVDKLIVPDAGSAGRLPVYLEAIDRLYVSVGDIVPIFAYIPCPFTTAAGLRGVESFLMDTLRNVELAHFLLKVSLEAAIALCDECVLMGALPILVDPLASGSVISRRTYNAFAQPYETKLIEYLHRYDLDITLHICGDTSFMLDLIVETGADLFSFDQADFGDAVTKMGEKTRLVGNIPPNALLESSKLEIDDAVNSIINIGLSSPKGMVVSTGCEAPISSNEWKVEALIETGKRCRYNMNW